jgi:TRAP transporter TAXI family solute receptor
MKPFLILSWAIVFGWVCALGVAPPRLQAKTTYVTIGTGGYTGVYHPTGSAIARMVNKKRKTYGIRYTVESTDGSAYNVNAVMSGELEFGLVQSDRQYQAFNGLAEWRNVGPQTDLRAVFSIHPETSTLIAAVDAKINRVKDLVGKRVNIGNPGSGHRQNAIDALTAFGINWRTDLQAKGFFAEEAPGLLQAGRIDALFYTVGHPNQAIKEATSGTRAVRFIPLAGLEIDRLVMATSYYAVAMIPVSTHYPGAAYAMDVPSFGVKATLVTSAKVPQHIVYAVTKEVFDNIAAFKKLHPAYQGLTPRGMLEGLSAPLHPGALRYYEEAGLR